MRAPIAEFLNTLKQDARDTTEQGGQFEKLTLGCLSVIPTYHHRYAKVWRWKQWAGQRGVSRQDTGIDLVAETLDGRYCAIQCKFFQPGHTLQKSDIDSFLAAANQRWGMDEEIVFSEMIVVSTAAQLSPHVRNSLARQRISAIHLSFDELAAELPDDLRWEELVQTRSYRSLWRRLHQERRKSLRPHQKKALEDVLAGFKKSDRGKLIMACGTGKTLLSVKVAERMLRGKGGNVLFLAPSLALVSQTLREWSAQFAPPEARFFAVCSDSKVGRESEDISVHELAIPATTDSARLAERLRPPPPPIKRA